MSDTKTFTGDQVSEAANAAMDLILGEIELGQSEEELLGLMVSATVTVLTSDMGADFEDVVAESYGEDVYEFKSARGW